MSMIDVHTLQKNANHNTLLLSNMVFNSLHGMYLMEQTMPLVSELHQHLLRYISSIYTRHSDLHPDVVHSVLDQYLVLYRDDLSNDVFRYIGDLYKEHQDRMASNNSSCLSTISGDGYLAEAEGRSTFADKFSAVIKNNDLPEVLRRVMDPKFLLIEQQLQKMSEVFQEVEQNMQSHPSPTRPSLKR